MEHISHGSLADELSTITQDIVASELSTIPDATDSETTLIDSLTEVSEITDFDPSEFVTPVDSL